MVPVLLAVGAVGAVAILLMPKKASAATPPGGTTTPLPSGNTINTPQGAITLLSSGSDPTKAPYTIPAFTAPPASDVGIYLQTFDAAGNGLWPGSPVPMTADLTGPVDQAAAKAGNLAPIAADGAFAAYFTPVSKSGKTLVWAASKGVVLNWWLTQWS